MSCRYESGVGSRKLPRPQPLSLSLLPPCGCSSVIFCALSAVTDLGCLNVPSFKLPALSSMPYIWWRFRGAWLELGVTRIGDRGGISGVETVVGSKTVAEIGRPALSSPPKPLSSSKLW